MRIESFMFYNLPGRNGAINATVATHNLARIVGETCWDGKNPKYTRHPTTKSKAADPRFLASYMPPTMSILSRLMLWI